MSRILILLLVAVLAALALVYGLRLVQKRPTTELAALLPRDTVVLVHFPDFNRTRDEWHESDIYQLYREPAVQDFLGRPLSRVPETDSVKGTVQEIERLELKDGFIAITSLANNDFKVVGGFRFRGRQAEADKIIAHWRVQLFGSKGEGQPIEYEHHTIQTQAGGSQRALRTAYDGNWFFAADDLDELKAVLDRVDGRAKDSQTLLSSDENFREAVNEMPAGYALLFYMQPKAVAQRLNALRAQLSGTNAGNNVLEQMRSLCAATRFDKGKLHDVAFVGMPKPEEKEVLKRDSLALATRDTFLYADALVDVSKQLGFLDSTGSSTLLATPWQKFRNALASSRALADDWKAAFGPEFAILSDWSGDKHWPDIIATCEVKDPTRTQTVLRAVLHAFDEDASWLEADRNDAHYWLLQKGPDWLSLHPVIGLSKRVLVVGLDQTVVEAAVGRSEKSTNELPNSPAYKQAARLVPEPTNFFSYLELGLFYARLDATLRPLLMMSAAFLPSMNQYVDVSKLPASEVITKHLSPIVSSRRYNGHGYVMESAGPITLDQALAATAILAAVGTFEYYHGLPGLVPSRLRSTGSPAPAPGGGGSGRGFQVPNPSPSPTPQGTP